MTNKELSLTKHLTDEERENIREDLIEQDKRAAFMRHLYHVFGRNDPKHPKHGFYTGLWEEFCIEEAGYVVREMFFERLEAVRLYEKNKKQQAENLKKYQETIDSNVYTSPLPESDSNDGESGE